MPDRSQAVLYTLRDAARVNVSWSHRTRRRPSWPRPSSTPKSCAASPRCSNASTATCATPLTSLHAQLSSLGDTWRDQEHDRFRLEFEQTMTVIERFLEASDEHVPFLMHKAQHIEDYLHQR